MLDNFTITKKMVGKFILSQLNDIFTLESAKKILGSAFIYDNFNVPVNIILERGLSKLQNGYDNEITDLERETMLEYPQVQVGQPITDETGKLVTKVDTDTADSVIKSVLNNKDLVLSGFPCFVMF